MQSPQVPLVSINSTSATSCSPVVLGGSTKRLHRLDPLLIVHNFAGALYLGYQPSYLPATDLGIICLAKLLRLVL